MLVVHIMRNMIIVWQKGTLKSSDGAGHVAIVTYVNNVNDPTQIKTSESGYGAKSPFWQTTRNKGNGNWGQASSYKYRGCIAPVGYKPPEPPKPTPTPTRKFKEGDRVVLNGPIYLSSMSNIPSNTIKDKITTVTRVVKGECKHPYNTTGDLGWCDASSLSFLMVLYIIELMTQRLLILLKTRKQRLLEKKLIKVINILIILLVILDGVMHLL